MVKPADLKIIKLIKIRNMSAQNNENAIRKQCRNAVKAGRQYLISCVENNLFYDQWFGTVVPPPVEKSASPMLCFFTALALQKNGEIPDSVKKHLHAVLDNAKKGASYGYDEKAPIDADDTAFALRTLIITGEAVSPEMITEALKPFKCADSWFTFPISVKNCVKTPPFHNSYTGPVSVGGPHPEVHLNILSLFQDAGIIVSRIPAVALKNGLPVSYFYPSSYYGAWLFSAICRRMKLQYHSIENAAVRCRLSDGSWSGVENGFSAVQESALAMLTLDNYAHKEQDVWLRYEYLLAQQQKNGSFPGGTLWKHRLPVEKGEASWCSADVMSIVSTGSAVLALMRAVPDCTMRN